MKFRGYAALYSSATVFAFVSVLVKLASDRYGGLFVSAARFAVGTCLCVAALIATEGGVKPRRLKLLLLRGSVGVLSMITVYLSIGLTGPGRATLLSNLYPLFVVIFGSLWFGETFRAKHLLSIACCVVGAALIVRDGSGASALGDALALGSAVVSGIAVNIVRRLSKDESPFMIYLSPCLFGLVLFFLTPLPSPATLFGEGATGPLLLVGVGAGAFLGQSLMAYGYREVQAGSGSIVFYWETLLTIGLGALIVGERLNLIFGLGLLLILAGLRINQGPLVVGKRRRP